MSALHRLALLAHRRRGWMLVAWIAAFAAIVALVPSIAGEYDAEFRTEGSESEAAAHLIEERFPGRSGDSIDVVWRAERGAAAPAVARRVDRLLAEAQRLEGVGAAEPPRVAPGGTIATASLPLDRPAFDVPKETGERLIELAEDASGGGLRVELLGGPIQQAQEGGEPEVVSLVAALVILLIAFGSIVAAGLPIVTALFGLGISATLIGVVAAVMDVPDFAPAVASLIGIGVGIDYALLILTRYRGALHAGRDVEAAVVEAVTTAGRSVVVAGCTVVISLAGLFLVGAGFLRGVALSASVAVLVVMLAAITLLPALLSLLGDRVDRLKIPGLGRHEVGEAATVAGRWSHLVQRRPWAFAAAALVVLAVLTAPVAGQRLGFPDAGNDREGTTTRAAYDLLARGFGPGQAGPLLLAAELSPGTDATALEPVRRAVAADPDVARVAPARANPAGDAALIAVTPRTSPQDVATEDLVRRLRDDVVPPAAQEAGATVHVGGLTAAFIDQSEQTASRLPVFIGGVVGMSFLLLLAAFRAPVVALKAAVMNLLSIGAAYGVVALAAEGGWLGGLMGVDTETPVPSWVPVMMFAILFGLSMDYEVFLLSRIREEYLRDGDAHRAVADGLAKTARVITAAAAIMICVFLAFLLSPEVFLKLMGLGMATAILVDATIVRLVLVPAVMQLLGDRNWWIPGWLDRVLPRLEVEAAAAPAAPAAGEA